MESQALLTAALALPESDRARLAQELLASLAPDEEDPDESDFQAELDRRFEECCSDPSASVSWSEMKRKR